MVVVDLHAVSTDLPACLRRARGCTACMFWAGTPSYPQSSPASLLWPPEQQETGSLLLSLSHLYAIVGRIGEQVLILCLILSFADMGQA